MKKLFIAATVLLVAFTACNGGSDKSTATSETASAEGSTGPELSGEIAYIRLDSLMANYNMFKDLSAEFETKAKQVEADLASRGRTLEKNYADAQNKMEKGLVTRAEAAQLQENLQRQEQNFYAFREQKSQELAEENAVMTNKIFYSVEEFVKEFNSDYRYGMILTTSGGTPVLHANPSLDITSLVLKGLNEKYASQKNVK